MPMPGGAGGGNNIHFTIKPTKCYRSLPLGSFPPGHVGRHTLYFPFFVGFSAASAEAALKLLSQPPVATE